MKFEQPSTSAVAYNRVTGGNASHIQGKLTANGKVYLANPNGVIITKGAEINVAGLLATTKDLERISENGNTNTNTNKFTRKAKEGKVLTEGQVINEGKLRRKISWYLMAMKLSIKGTLTLKKLYNQWRGIFILKQ